MMDEGTILKLNFVFCLYFLLRRFFFEEACPLPIAHTKKKNSPRQTKIEWNCDGVRADAPTLVGAWRNC